MTLDLAAIEERAKLYVGVAEGRGHLDALARDVLALVEEVRMLRAALSMAGRGSDAEAAERLRAALSREPAGGKP